MRCLWQREILETLPRAVSGECWSRKQIEVCGAGNRKAEREMLKERHTEGTWPHLLLPDLQSPGGRMCKEVERKAQGDGLLFCPVWVFGEGHCDR